MTQDPAPAQEHRPGHTTGHPAVDQVIAAVEELEDRPVEEHVGVFEAAQAELRRALDDRGDPGEPDAG